MGYLHTDKPYPRGEICMKGLTIFQGYYKRPDKTAESFDSEGWFKTGDVAIVTRTAPLKLSIDLKTFSSLLRVSISLLKRLKAFSRNLLGSLSP